MMAPLIVCEQSVAVLSSSVKNAWLEWLRMIVSNLNGKQGWLVNLFTQPHIILCLVNCRPICLVLQQPLAVSEHLHVCWWYNYLGMLGPLNAEYTCTEHTCAESHSIFPPVAFLLRSTFSPSLHPIPLSPVPAISKYFGFKFLLQG